MITNSGMVQEVLEFVKNGMIISGVFTIGQFFMVTKVISLLIELTPTEIMSLQIADGQHQRCKPTINARGVDIIRNPNGYGSVVKLSGNRRKPFAVRKTTGWNEKGHPIYLSIGYYPTRQEGMIALAEYNKSPWDIDAEKVTLESLYAQWMEKKTSKIGKGTLSSLKSAYQHTKPIWSMKYKEIKSFHMQDIIDNCGRGYSTQWAIKNLFGHLDRFALEIDVINKGYAVLTTAEPIPDSKKVPFTVEEVQTVWEHKDEPWMDSILVFLYSGFRISELLDLKVEDVNIEDMTFKGGKKTKSGKDRIIPIHPAIADIVQDKVNEGNKYLFTHNNKKVHTSIYYSYWNDAMVKHQMQHTPHECRHTFRSRLDSAGANKKCIDMLMGHKSKDVGERVYTHKTIEELREAILLLDK